MKNFPRTMMLLGAALLTLPGIQTSAAQGHQLRGQDHYPLGKMKKPSPTRKWSGGLTLSQKQQRISPNLTIPESDGFQYLYAPDGTEWYAVCSYDSEKIRHNDEYSDYTETILKGFKYTIYDNHFNEVGTVSDTIELEDGETRCAQVMLDYTLTKNFFNNDSKYEVMVSLSMNTPDYSVNIRTKAYSIEKTPEGEYSMPIAVIPGYPIDAVNCARDRWSEDFYITFLTEEEGNIDDYEDYIDFLGSLKQNLTTYGKGSRIVMERSMRKLDLPGDQMNSPGFLCKNVDGKLTLIYAQYEKSFFENPAGMFENDNVNPDNKLIIDVYQMKDSYTKEMELACTTKIDAVQNTSNPEVYCTFYGIGTLMWDKDVDYGTYTADGRPTFVVTVDDCLYFDDEHYNSGYYVYDADGNRIKTIAEDTYGYVLMSDLPGFEPQAMFILTENKNFQFVDLYSCRTVTEVDPNINGLGLTTSIDRTATANGYAYASALSSGTTIDGVNVAAPVCWIDTNGDIIRIDKIPVGENVELAQIYMNSDALNPYVFNTDNNLEYMLLVKRRMPTGELREELLISSPESGVLYSFTEEEGKGAIRTVLLMPGSIPQLIVAYLNDDDKFTADTYSLPLTKFAGGKGTAEDPYLIATAGDLQQIKSATGAHYVLTSDLDCGSIFFQTIEEFSGTLDGKGHTVSNLKIPTPANGKTGIFRECNNAVVKDIDFYNATLILSGDYEAGLITATASGSTLDNIHVRRLTASSDGYSGEFGGIAGKMWTRTSVSGCEVAGADIDLPSCPSAGGITGDIRTGCTITACAFSGNLTAQSTLGGIVGSTTTGDETISQCHVNANLKAENTIGGIVGFLDRSKVSNNYVEGTIEATKPSKWTKSIGLGGIVGELEGDWQGKGDIPVEGNLIGVSALIAPDLTETEESHPRQLATVHRVVGRSSYNTYFEEEPGKIVYENGVVNNLVVSGIAAIDPETAESGIEGITTDRNELEQETLAQLGFAYGTTNDAPWNIQSWYAYDPDLYFENVLYIPKKEITVEKGETFDVEIAILSLENPTEESIMDDFMCEFDESVLQMTGNMNYDSRTLRIELTAINCGRSQFSTSILGGSANCLVTVSDQNSVEGVEADMPVISMENGYVKAGGCRIIIMDITGKTVMTSRDVAYVSVLPGGAYIATATDSKGNRTALKFVK